MARDPRVCCKIADKVTSVLRDVVLRHWEMTKLITLLPTEVLQLLAGLSPEAFAQGSVTDVAIYIFAKANTVEHSTIWKGRHTLHLLLD